MERRPTPHDESEYLNSSAIDAFFLKRNLVFAFQRENVLKSGAVNAPLVIFSDVSGKQY